MTRHDRVQDSTSAAVNRAIAAIAEDSVRHHAAHPQEIDARLAALDREWDIERALEANASLMALSGLLLSIAGRPRWLLLPVAVTTFLAQHAFQGWCPPLPVLRRLKFRTRREIEVERVALKALRGDFGPIGPGAGDHDSRASHALQAARL